MIPNGLIGTIEKYRNKPIIYAITNKASGKKYIGQTIDIKKRWYSHTTASQHRKYSYINNAMNKYGTDQFLFEVLETVESEKILNSREQYYIDLYNTMAPVGYNLKTNDGHSGKSSEEFKKKLSESKKNRRPVIGVHVDTREVLILSHMNANKDLGWSHSIIMKCCRQDTWHKTYKNYVWDYLQDGQTEPTQEHLERVEKSKIWNVSPKSIASVRAANKLRQIAVIGTHQITGEEIYLISMSVDTRFSKHGISRACLHNEKYPDNLWSHNGYIWRKA